MPKDYKEQIAYLQAQIDDLKKEVLSLKLSQLSKGNKLKRSPHLPFPR